MNIKADNGARTKRFYQKSFQKKCLAHTHTHIYYTFQYTHFVWMKVYLCPTLRNLDVEGISRQGTFIWNESIQFTVLHVWLTKMWTEILSTSIIVLYTE